MDDGWIAHNTRRKKKAMLDKQLGKEKALILSYCLYIVGGGVKLQIYWILWYMMFFYYDIVKTSVLAPAFLHS